MQIKRVIKVNKHKFPYLEINDITPQHGSSLSKVSLIAWPFNGLACNQTSHAAKMRAYKSDFWGDIYLEEQDAHRYT